jgi:hypothetical protein
MNVLMCSCGEYCSVFSDPLCLKLAKCVCRCFAVPFSYKSKYCQYISNKLIYWFFDNNKTDFVSYNSTNSKFFILV